MLAESSAAAAPALDVDALIRSIAIPPRPALLVEVQEEMGADDPDFGHIAHLIGCDVALTAGVLRSVNSPFYALSRKAGSLHDAIALLGLRQIGALVTGFALRQAVQGDKMQLTRFWDVSGKRSYALSRLAHGLRGVAPDVAQSFGLFCDVGIPLLMPRFPDYAQTIKQAAKVADRPFTAVEQAAHKTDHALIGALMARTWGLSNVVCQAIRQHHETAALVDPEMPEPVARLAAMGVLAELAIQRQAGHPTCAEWSKSGPAACAVLGLDDREVEGWMVRLHEGCAEV